MRAMFLAAAAAVIIAAPASAAVFDFTYSYDLTRTNTITVTGQLTGDQIANSSNYQITGITGVRTATLSAVGPYTITGLAVVNAIGGNDNILTYFAPRAVTDPAYYTPSANGIAFLESSGPSPVRIYSTVAQQRTGMAQENFNTTTGTPFRFTISLAPTPAVPEPATWAMMTLGFGAIGFGLRRKAKVATRVRFA